jgi:hypothetical protein
MGVPAVDLSGVLFGLVATAVLAGVTLIVLAAVVVRHRHAASISALGLGLLGVPAMFYALTLTWYLVVEGTGEPGLAVIGWALWALCWGAAVLLVINAVRRPGVDQDQPGKARS